MGWWKCNESGGIDWGQTVAGSSHYYNGDAPADYMSAPVEVIKMWFQNRPVKPTTNELIDLFVNNKVSKVFKFINPAKLENLVSVTWLAIDEIYKNALGRPTYKQEKIYVCMFVFK